MSPALKTLLILFSFSLLANALISFYIWKFQNQEVYKKLVIIWTGMLVNFVLQGLSPDLNLFTILAFSTYLISSFGFLSLSYDLVQERCSLKHGPKLVAALFASSILAWFVTKSFMLSAFIMSAAVTVPQLQSICLLWRAKNAKSFEFKALALFLTLNVLHLYDYAFLRPIPEGALFGFSLALFIVFLMSITLPALITRKYANEKAGLLSAEVHLRTSELEAAMNLNKTLVSIMCHDLATPISIVELSNRKLLKAVQANSTEDIQKINGRISKAVIKMTDMVNSVRKLHSVQQGKIAINIDEINLEQCIDEVIESFDESLKNKNIKIRVHKYNEQKIMVKTDRSIFTNQVFSNLLSNALKFSHENSKIDILLSKNNDFINIEVQDYGIGIPKELVNTVFEIDKKTSRKGTLNEEGTGFGLPLVKSCTSLIGGRISVKSQTSEDDGVSGTIFKIELPAA